MGQMTMIPIMKDDILFEDFSNINKVIQTLAEDKGHLLQARNTWEVYFEGYDEDPREVPDIPEIVNWIKQSVEEGIPWFYFMSTSGQAPGLSTFLVSIGAEHDPNYPERYFMDRDKILPFIEKNLKNMEDFAEQYDIPDTDICAATDAIMEFVQKLLLGEKAEPAPAKEVNRRKMISEAHNRIQMLEELFDLNPKVGKYFQGGRLYYSYLTCGGIIGSIDSIDYDKRYADAVKMFENQTNALVYHAIEYKNTLSLLYVSNDYDEWESERPTSAGIKSCIIDIETMKGKYGYIKIDINNGALYRRDSTVYSSLLPNKQSDTPDPVSAEIVERLEILKNAGIETDLDITRIYTSEREICCSFPKVIMGMPIGLINRVSTTPYEELLEYIEDRISQKVYFVIGSIEKKIAFLLLSDNPSDWENEKLQLEKMRPYALVFDINERSAKVQQINFRILNGGPVLT